MSKQEADNLLKIEISWLWKNGFLKSGINFYQIKWHDYFGREYFIVDVSTCINDADSFIILRYSSEGEKIKDKIFLTTTNCNLGGRRYWFLCFSCNKRVGNLYKVGQYFACRHCHDLTYKSRNLKKSLREDIIFNTCGDIIKAQSLQGQIRRQIYAGKLTKKQQRLNWLYAKLPF